MLQRLGPDGMSSDESEREGSMSRGARPKNPLYRVLTPVWRAEDVGTWLAAIDSVHMTARHEKGDFRGQYPRLRDRGGDVSQSTNFVPSLPITSYDRLWLESKRGVDFTVKPNRDEEYDFHHHNGASEETLPGYVIFAGSYREHIQHFLDIEAHVDSEDDTQDDPSAGPDALLDDFLVESSDSDSDEPNSTSTSKLGAQYYQREREELQASVDALRTRHGTSESLAHADSERWMSFLKYPPSIQDPELWRVRVRPRWEFSVVATILNKSQALKIPVSSAFYRDSIPGAVYIEGSYHDCVTVLDGINGVWLNHYNTSAIEHVHFSDRIALLDQTTSNPAPPKHTFVRLRCRGPYRHMLAFIKEVSTSSEVEVLVVPRSRSEGSFLPLALAMTEPSQTEPYIPPSPIHDTHHVYGLRIRHIPVRSLQLSPSHPTSTELTLLESSPLFDLNTLDIPSTVDPSNAWIPPRNS
ncbi:hypothetical protein ONZ45_g19581 [Pleurotus djamor]|nr:hypothetical protein ONZ45_g19581 [Pleurotus djamor]